MKCPTCGSTNIRHITGDERATSVGFWGYLARRLTKVLSVKIAVTYGSYTL